MDADVIVQNSLNDIFEELRDNVLLYDINHSLSVSDYKIIIKEFEAFGEKTYITHYGGEFFGGSRKNAMKFISHCRDIYDEMVKRNFKTTKGDEFIVSIAASRMKDNIKNAGAYIFRFWTADFYLVSTCYKYNEVSILHLPNGKNSSIIKIYDRYISKNRLPEKKVMHKICHLDKPALNIRIKRFIKKILRINLKK